MRLGSWSQIDIYNVCVHIKTIINKKNIEWVVHAMRSDAITFVYYLFERWKNEERSAIATVDENPLYFLREPKSSLLFEVLYKKKVFYRLIKIDGLHSRSQSVFIECKMREITEKRIFSLIFDNKVHIVAIFGSIGLKSDTKMATKYSFHYKISSQTWKKNGKTINGKYCHQSH